MAAGEVLVIECTDPLATIDIPNLLRETGDRLEGSGKKGRVLTFTDQESRSRLHRRMRSYQFISFLVACSLSFRNLR